MIFPGEFNIGLKEGGKVNLPFMEEGLIDATIMVAYIPQGPRDDASLLKATDFAMNRLQEIHRQMELNRTRMCIAYTPQEVHVLKAAGKKAIMCLYKGFINEDAEKASLSDAIRHIDHIVDLIGINHVGIGSDFDGDGELIGCRASNELINITMRLLKEGYTENDIAKIWGGNLLRVMNKAQSAPDNSL